VRDDGDRGAGDAGGGEDSAGEGVHAGCEGILCVAGDRRAQDRREQKTARGENGKPHARRGVEE
jgi:hypothetical protein